MSACPRHGEVTRAFPRLLEGELRGHLDGCAHCAESWSELARVARLVKELAPPPASGSRREELRIELLARAGALPQHPRAGRVAWAAVAALAVAAGVALVTTVARRQSVAPPTAAAGYRATIEAQAGALFARETTQPDEVVRLTEGAIAVDVAPLAAGERFRVVTADGEVEVRGTAFEVGARRNRLTLVRVRRGHVEVRPAGEPARVIGPGEQWRRADTDTVADTDTATATGTDTAAATAAQPARGSPPRARRAAEPRLVSWTPAAPAATAAEPPPPAPPATPPREAEAAFRDGWSMLRGGDADAAAAAFERAARTAGDDLLAEDAWYWRAVALARAGRASAARDAFTSFLDRHPQSPRAGEASAMLGWLLVDAGDFDGAEARFTAAASDPVDKVRASAREGLAAIAKRRGAL